MILSQGIVVDCYAPRGNDSTPIYEAGESGPCWLIQSGVVRLSCKNTGIGETFAGIASAGDLLGSEVLLTGAYCHDAWPLGDVKLESCLKPSSDLLLHGLISAQYRTKQVLALREGEAELRIRRLLRILTGENITGSAMIFMPKLKEMAGMTSLNHETVSRVIGRLQHLGQLRRSGRHCGFFETDSIPSHPHAA